MTRPVTNRPLSARRGAVLIYLVVILVFTSIVAVAVIGLSVTSIETGMSSASSSRAQFLARSAVEYAQWQYCQLGGEWSAPLTITFAGGETATVDIDGGRFVATAMAYAGTRLESRAEAAGPVPECDSPPLLVEGASPSDYVIYTGSTGGTYALPSGSQVQGSVFGPQVTILPSSVNITGNIVSLGNVDLGSATTVGGYVCAGGNVLLRSANTTIAGDVYAFGNVTLESPSAILGNLYATGNVVLKSNAATVVGNIHAGGNVTLENATTVGGSVFAGGSVSMLSSNARVYGDVHAGTGFLSRRGRIDGDLVSGWNVDMIDGARVDGDVYTANNLIYGSGQPKVINGSSFAGGTRNDHNPASVLVSVPAPTEPEPPAGCPPTPPEPVKQVFSANSNHIVVPQNGNVTIAPGTYGNLTVGGASTITLQAGSPYIFQSISPAGWNTTLRLNLSTGDRITVFVVGSITYSGRVEISTDGVNYTRVRFMDTEVAKLLAKHVYWEAHATFNIATNNSIREWFGTVLTEGNMNLASGFYIVGATATISGTVTSSSPQQIFFSIADFALENWIPNP